MRFANAEDGWVFGPDLWATHDGGATWHQVTLGAGASGPGFVNDVEAAGGDVQAAVGDGGGAGIDLEASSVSSDAWHLSPTVVPYGAGPVAQATITLAASAGWVVEDDRTVIGGARLEGGAWRTWQPPCVTGDGPATIAAATTTQLAAVCDEGEYSNGPPHVRVYISVDGGSHFVATPAQPPLSSSQGAANPSPGVVVTDAPLSAGTQLVATFNGGRTWSTVYQASTGGSISSDLGFTTPTQGVIIVRDTAAGTGQLLMTFDGGHHWAPVRLP